MPLTRAGAWRIVVTFSAARDDAGQEVLFTAADADGVKQNLNQSARSDVQLTDDGRKLRIAIIVADKTFLEVWGLAMTAAETTLFPRSVSPQMWEIQVHTTGEYVKTAPSDR